MILQSRGWSRKRTSSGLAWATQWVSDRKEEEGKRKRREGRRRDRRGEEGEEKEKRRGEAERKRGQKEGRESNFSAC